MAVSVLAAAATQTSSLGILNLTPFDNLSRERLPLSAPSPAPSDSHSNSHLHPHSHPRPKRKNDRTFNSTFFSLDPSSTSTNTATTSSSLSSSPHQYPTDLTHPILEEGDETDSEAANEPVTPVSGRQSQDFHTLANHDIHPDVAQEHLVTDANAASFSAVPAGTTPGSKPPLALETGATPHNKAPKSPASSISQSQETPRAAGAALTPTTTITSVADQDSAIPPPSRRPTFSSSNLRRNMSSFLKRVTHGDKAPSDSGSSTAASDHHSHEGGHRKLPTRRWSMNRSSATTRSNTPPSNSPPSPSSPIEMAIRTRDQASKPTLPDSESFMKKKPRASTSFLRARPHVPKGGDQLQLRRRASSFDYTSQEPATVAGSSDGEVDVTQMAREVWEMPAETGTGLKARRMSLSLPDDFVVDVAELLAEFEYEHHKILGRHGKALGKGGHAKVKTMMRKGCPTELVAVKEFRGKSRSESKEDYEKKIKSEFTLSKSLNHPNVVSTIRLCIDHGRWNHVMEYCSEGDLFAMVKDGHFKGEDREKDRLCLFKQLVRGVNYLHANGIAHRDIKLENLLLTSDSALKIADFGVSEVFSGTHPGLREAGGQCGKNMGEIRRCAPGICGSTPYMAPEVLHKGADYDPRGVDVWSSAVVMLHLIFGGAIWAKADIQDAGSANYGLLVRGWDKWNEKHRDTEGAIISEADYPYVKPFDLMVKPPALRRVLLQMLNPNPDKRSSIGDVVNNRWVKNIECCQKADNEEPDPATTMIDASKKGSLIRGGQKLFCHNHAPAKKQFSGHSLGKMPGQAGY